jgi:hypothetical protein
VLAAADAALGDDLLGERLRRMLRLWLQAWSNGKGLPTGISISPMLSNLVMAQAVDGWMADQLASGRFEAGIRYADDLALVTADPERTLDDLRARLATAKLHLNEDKTRVIREEGPWPEVVLGVPIGLAGGRLAPRLVKTSPPRRKGRESR